MPARLRLAEMTREQIRQVAAETLVVIPTASIEQHGPHLPISTDTIICEAVCLAAAERAAADARIAVAPIVVYGISDHHKPYPGVVSLPSLLFTQLVSEVASSLVASGFRRIAIVNGHGGNDESVRMVARDLANTHPVAVAATSYWTFGRDAPGLAAALGKARVPGHAGTFETSLILALRPELVDGRPQAGSGSHEDSRPGVTVARAGGRVGDGPGHTDDASGASADLGQRIFEAIADDLASFLRDFARQ